MSYLTCIQVADDSGRHLGVCASGTGVFNSGASCLPETRRALDRRRGYKRYGTSRKLYTPGSKKVLSQISGPLEKPFGGGYQPVCWCPCKPPSCQGVGKGSSYAALNSKPVLCLVLLRTRAIVYGSFFYYLALLILFMCLYLGRIRIR